MKNRLFHFGSQGSIMAAMTMAVALMTFHGQPSRDVKASASGINHLSGASSVPALGMTKIDFNPNIYHNPYGH